MKIGTKLTLPIAAGLIALTSISIVIINQVITKQGEELTALKMTEIIDSAEIT